MKQLGIDIGGSGIKGAVVEISSGNLLTERHRIPTPSPATPDLVVHEVAAMVKHFDWKGKVGCSFPAIVRDGVCLSAGNISQEWIGVKIDKLFSDACGGMEFAAGNDADLAGVAEMTLGAGKGLPGKVMMITIGTGLGTALFFKGQLIPNMELGRIFHTDGKPIEFYAADSARKKDNLTIDEWAKRFTFFLNHIERTISPRYFIIGGGISKRFDEFRDLLEVNTPVLLAQFRNNAGIIGAAMHANEALS